MKSPRIAMVQMLVEGAKPGENLERARRRIALASRLGADIAVLPECLDFGWTDPGARQGAQPIPGRHAEVLAAAARANRIWVVAGLAERDGERLFNSAVLIDSDGRLRLVHRKINELAIALDLYTVGDRLGLVQTEFGRVAVDICADNLPESLVLGKALGQMGARILLSPSAWAVDANHDNDVKPYRVWDEPYRELARAHEMLVVGVSSVGWLRAGPWRGRKVIGNSLAVGSDGQVIARAPYGPEADVVVMLDPTGRAQVHSTST